MFISRFRKDSKVGGFVSANGSPTVYVFINKGLHMSVGKVAAQAVHAAGLSLLADDAAHKWIMSPARTVIVLQATDEAQIRNIQDYLKQKDIDSHIVVDEGANEITPMTITALATRVLDRDDLFIVSTMKQFKTYHDDIKVTLEIPR